MTQRVAKDGTRKRMSITVSPVRNAAGEIIGASKIGREIGSETAGGSPDLTAHNLYYVKCTARAVGADLRPLDRPLRAWDLPG